MARAALMSQNRPLLSALFGLACIACPATLGGGGVEEKIPLVYPIPQQLERLPGTFQLTQNTCIALPEKASQEDRSLARFLAAELADRWGVPVVAEQVPQLPINRPVIVMGTADNSLVKEACKKIEIQVTKQEPGREGYVLHIDKQVVLVAGSDNRGAFYGLQSLRQLIRPHPEGAEIGGVQIVDRPYKPFRGVKLFLPGRDHIPFFKRFLRDFMALYKFNELILEMNAGMRLDRHPELAAGWIEFANDLNYSRRDRPQGPGAQFQDSAHHDTADGRVLEKSEVEEIIRCATENYIEVIPELPSLTHSYYLLTRHRELAEIQAAEWPDTYCPSNPKSYELLFDVFEEYIEVMKPRILHIGHDEWRMPVGVCPQCRGKDQTELFIEDLNRIHSYLSAKGIRVAIWGDHLMERVRGRGPESKISPSRYQYQSPGALSPDQVRRHVPKDILIFNWFWQDGDSQGGAGLGGEKNDLQLQEWGFEQVYGNFSPEIKNYARRSSLRGVIGGAPSCWAVTSEFSIGKDRLYQFLGCANLLWSKHWLELSQLSDMVQSLMPDVRRNLHGQNLPSDDGDPVVALGLFPSSNSELLGRFRLDLDGIRSGRIEQGRKIFDISQSDASSSIVSVFSGAGKSRSSKGIPINEDVSSLIFLHACARAARSDWVDRYVYNPADTSDLLGFYEIVYEDGYVVTVPIRYKVNILEWDWGKHKNPAAYCYEAEVVDISKTRDKSINFFAFEWVNPRFGKVIKEVRLHGSVNFTNASGTILADNAVLLAALSAVKRRNYPEPVKAR